MGQIIVQSTFLEFESEKALSTDDRALLQEARESLRGSYAPYSRFHVGAAVRLENDVIVKGNNQENASYPVGMCAERVAVFAAGANYPGLKITALAIAAHSAEFVIDKPVAPCGACRQAIAEYEHRYKHPVRIILSGESGKILIAESIRHFLPWMFSGDDLKRKNK